MAKQPAKQPYGSSIESVQDSIGESSAQVPESSAYVPETTMLPETGHIPASSLNPLGGDGDSVAVVGDTMFNEEAEHGKAKQASKPKAASAGGLKAYLPYIGGGVAAVVIGGLMYLKFFGGEPPAPVAVAPKPAPTVAPAPVAKAPDLPAPAPAPAPAPTSTPAPAPDMAPPAPTPVIAAPMPDPAPMPSPAPVAKAPDPAPAPAPAPVKPDTSAANAAALRERDQRIDELTSRVASLQADLNEASRKVAESQREVAMAQRELADARNTVQTLRERVASAQRAASAPPAAAAGSMPEDKPASVASTAKVMAEEFPGFTLHAVRNGLAWVQLPDDTIVVVASGDSLPGVGRITAVDEVSHTIRAGRKLLR